MKSVILLFLSMVILPAAVPAQSPLLQKNDLPKEIAKWEKDIAKLEELDKTEPAIQGGILFCGSSSIRLWKTIADDMQPWKAIKRGYGGARLSDLNHYADRLIGPHIGSSNPNRVRAVVIFVANDISGSKKKKDPAFAEVGQRFQRLHQIIRRKDASVPVFWIEVTPCNSRWHVWPEIERATDKIRETLNRDPVAYFIPTAGAFMNASGKPKSGLFVKDQLHLNPQGYQLWSSLIKTQLRLRLGSAIQK